MKPPDETQGRRSRRRPSSADVSHAVFDRTRSYRHLRNPFEPLKVFSDDQVGAMHEAALVMLETQGMKVLSADARDDLSDRRRRRRRYDADRARRPRFGRRFAREHAARDHLALGRSGAPCAAGARQRGVRADLGTAQHHGDGERPARGHARVDFRNLMKLCQSFEVIHVLGGATEPQDVPVHVRHLEVTRSQLMLSTRFPLSFRAATARSPTTSS